MKAKILYDRERPKVDPKTLAKVVRESGFDIVSRGEEVGVVVGGDGIFSYFGRTESAPLLFVGVKSNRRTGSKAYMAQTYFDELPSALARLKEDRYRVTEHHRLEVMRDGKVLGEVFTDVYLQRGDESNSLRYGVRVTGGKEKIEEKAIGDGVVVTTAAGATGYYSYLDRVAGGNLDIGSSASIGEDEVGICHILPTFSERVGSEDRPVRYTIPWGETVEVWITRKVEARLYGVEAGRKGIGIGLRDVVKIRPGKNMTKVIVLQ